MIHTGEKMDSTLVTDATSNAIITRDLTKYKTTNGVELKVKRQTTHPADLDNIL